jgi:hypothetical protein
MPKLKVYTSPPESFATHPFKPIVLSGFDVLVPFCEDVFEITTDFITADIVPFISKVPYCELEQLIPELLSFDLSNKVFVHVGSLMHIAEHYSIEDTVQEHEQLPIHQLFRHLPEHARPKVVTLHTNLTYDEYPQHRDVIYTDFMWNRHVALFVTQPDVIFEADLQQIRNHWYPPSDPVTSKFKKSVYKLYDLDQACSAEFVKEIQSHMLLKKYISANNTRMAHQHRKYYTGFHSETASFVGSEESMNVRDFLRTELIEKLQKYPGFLGDCAAHNFIMGQDMNDIDMERSIPGINFTMYPPHNAYYKASVLSIYVESLVNPLLTATGKLSIRSITEKTWDPLIKGSFILPFGYYGMIRDLKEHYGVQFPEWIDYSYDQESNDLRRWSMYLNSVYTVLNLPAEQLFQYKIRDKDILKHNKDLFFKIGYRETISEAILSLGHF